MKKISKSQSVDEENYSVINDEDDDRVIDDEDDDSVKTTKMMTVYKRRRDDSVKNDDDSVKNDEDDDSVINGDDNYSEIQDAHICLTTCNFQYRTTASKKNQSTCIEIYKCRLIL